MATRYRFSVEEYERLFQGVPRVELIRGEVYQMSPQTPKHAYALDRLAEVLREALGERAIVSVQRPLRLKDSEPEPDILVLKPPREAYWERHPEAGDVLLLVEVSFHSLPYDREVKLPLYAEAGIPEVWILNLEEGLLEVYRTPREGRYRQALFLSPGEEAVPLAFLETSLPWWPSP